MALTARAPGQTPIDSAAINQLVNVLNGTDSSTAITAAGAWTFSNAAGVVLNGDPGITLGTAVSRIVPGATSLSFRNHANAADNLILTDAGAATFRSTVALPGVSMGSSTGPTAASNSNIARINLDSTGGNGFNALMTFSVKTSGGATKTWFAGVVNALNSTEGNYEFYDGSNDILILTPGGKIRPASIGTTASAANAFLDNADFNNLLRSTSSKIYKNVRGYIPLAEARATVLALKPVVYTSKSPSDNPNTHYIGLLAEDVHALDKRLVTFRNDHGVKAPDWVMYDRLPALMALVIQDHEARIRALGG